MSYYGVEGQGNKAYHKFNGHFHQNARRQFDKKEKKMTLLYPIHGTLQVHTIKIILLLLTNQLIN